MRENIISFDNAVSILKLGGIVIYQTETLLAIGCDATKQEPVDAIFAIKGRPCAKPLPILAADKKQAMLVARLAAPPKLLRLFWPGPLTVVLPAKKTLASHVANAVNMVAVRVTASPLAALLAGAAGKPLIATSANLSGENPAASPPGLSVELRNRCRDSGLPWGILAPDQPTGCPPPSTIVLPERSESRWRLSILREGAVSRRDLENENWDLL